MVVPGGFDSHALPGGGANELIGASQYAFFFYKTEQGIGGPAARSG